MAQNMQGFSYSNPNNEKIQMIHIRREQFKEQVNKSMNIAVCRSIPKINSAIKDLELNKGTILQVKWNFNFICNSKGDYDLVATLRVFDGDGIVIYETLSHILFEDVRLKACIYNRNWKFMKKLRLQSKGIRFQLGDLIESEQAFTIRV